MAMDFVSEVDKKFFHDNLLLGEDWAWENMVPGMGALDDLGSLLDVEASISPEEFMKSLPDDLEIPMLDDHRLLSGHPLCVGDDLRFADPWKDLSDSSDSGMDCSTINIKDEPLSPASSLSSDTPAEIPMQSLILDGVEVVSGFPGNLPYDVKLESPPPTPSSDGSDIIMLGDMVPVSARTGIMPTTGVKLDFSKPTPQILQAPPATSIVQTVTVPTTTTTKVITLPAGVKTNLAQVLNSKVKIQPRPVAPVHPRTTMPSPAPGKPLVLTAEEFAKLTSQGVLKFHPPNEPPKSISTAAVPSAASIHTATVTIPTGSHVVVERPEMKIVKRQQRMIKNRESACLSRKRKKEYLQTMEQHLRQYTEENARLKEENSQLRKRVKTLHSENLQLKGAFPSSQAKKATCLLVVLLLLSLNLGPLTGLLPGGSTDHTKLLAPQLPPEGVVHHGRTLMSFKENVQPEAERSFRRTAANNIHHTLEILKKHYDSRGSGAASDLILMNRIAELNIPISMCPSYFNKSESQRLMNELTGWVLGHKAGMKAEQLQQQQQQTQQQKRHLYRRKKYVAPRKLKAALKAGVHNNLQYRYPDGEKPGHYEVQLFMGPDRSYQEFLQAIHRRNDTFYVVSFRRDHLLLPATSHNKTMRPKMSLVMPAVSINESMGTGSGNIAMMQIDCEVMATKLVHVHKSAIPQQASDRNYKNHTSSSHMDAGQSEDQRQRKDRQHWQQETHLPLVP